MQDVNRLSVVGRLLRKCRFDEFPQLLNVLVGDMSLIGPRPLLPRDQPANPAIRLSVRPGITGWAQVNGGNLVCAEEKDALDEWYIRNASLQLDVRIIFMTVVGLFRGERRSETAIEAAFAMRRQQCVVPPFETPHCRGCKGRTGRQRPGTIIVAIAWSKPVFRRCNIEDRSLLSAIDVFNCAMSSSPR